MQKYVSTKPYDYIGNPRSELPKLYKSRKCTYILHKIYTIILSYFPPGEIDGKRYSFAV